MAYRAASAFDEVPLWKQRVDRALPYFIGIGLVVAIGSLLFLTSFAAREQDEALKQQERSYGIVALARRLDASVAKAEASLARYVISLDKDIGRKYQDDWDRATGELIALQRSTRNDPVQRQLVDQLETAFNERGAVLSDIALRITYNQKTTALGKFYEASRAQSLTRITSLLEQVIEAENQRLEEHQVDVAKADSFFQQMATTYRLFGLALLIGLLFLAWVARAAIRERRQEQRLIRDEYARADALERAVAARTSELQRAYAKLKQEAADRERIEESLRQMQKMEAVGQLTGGIAHDFNNMLAVVVGGLELARRRVEGVHDVVRHIDNAMEGANRASALTRRLLAFARAEPHLPEAQSIDTVIVDMAELLDRSIGDQIIVDLDLQSDGWRVYTDRHQFENAVLNLAVNARDAMEGRGTLTLQTRQRRLLAREIGDCAAGEYLCLSVIDNGCGMSPEVLERVFEPFFTTKTIGKGTGLGLSQVFGFVGQCNGEVRILSEPGKGTEVELYLPRHVASGETETAKVAALPSANAVSDAGRETDTAGEYLSVLLVEDDPRVLAQTRSALVELGHRAICCDHPHNVLPLLESNSIDLILSDVLMPDMTGPEMVAALPARHQAIPVVFVTGYAGDITDNRMFEGHQLLRKPYTLKALRAAIAQAASRRPGSQAAAEAEPLQPAAGDDAARV
ncbi:MAG: ATP-binding protein [Sphingobium sp.]